MSKRFTDTDKWKKTLFKKLTLPYKLFWNFILDDCDHSGIWEVEDQQIIAHRIGEKIDLDTALFAFNEDEKRIHVFDGGKKWFIIPFVSFQYGDLNPKNKLHESVRRCLESKDLLVLIPVKGPLKGPKDLDKEKDKELEKEKGLLGEKPENRASLDGWFEELWLKYPNKDGKKHAKRHFVSSVKTGEDYARISKALENYLASKRVKDGFIKNASTWFNGWTDWEFYTETERSQSGEKSGLEKLRELRAKRVS